VKPTAASPPESMLAELLGRTTRPERERNLKLIHQICSVQNATSKDFSIRTVGRLCEAADGLKARALYNKASSDYRLLIKTWCEFSGGTGVARGKAAQDMESPFDLLLMKVADPALRSLFQKTYVERNRYRAELNMLKSSTLIQIDRRPLDDKVARQAPFEVLTGVELTQSERAALLRAISAEFLRDEGWHEGSSGEILNQSGRKIFDIGFTRAIRKVLGSSRASKG